jgi:hypothetical protein
MLNRATFQNDHNKFNTNYHKPVLIISGIMSFLGLENEEEKEDELITTLKRSVLLIQVYLIA